MLWSIWCLEVLTFETSSEHYQFKMKFLGVEDLLTPTNLETNVSPYKILLFKSSCHCGHLIRILNYNHSQTMSYTKGAVQKIYAEYKTLFFKFSIQQNQLFRGISFSCYERTALFVLFLSISTVCLKWVEWKCQTDIVKCSNARHQL